MTRRACQCIKEFCHPELKQRCRLIKLFIICEQTLNQSVATCEWFYRTEYLYTCKQFLNKQTLLSFLMPYTGWPKRYGHISTVYNYKILITYEHFFHITKFRIKYHFLNNFGKAVNLNFNGLTGVNSLCFSIYPNLSEKFQTS